MITTLSMKMTLPENVRSRYTKKVGRLATFVLKDIWTVLEYHMNSSFNLLEWTDVSFAF